MADPQHIEWLMEGVEAWNERRRKQNFTPFLQQADLSHTFRNRYGFRNQDRINLKKADLRGAQIGQAGLRGAEMQDADLREADMTQSDLREANLQNVDLREADMIQAKLRRANLKHANISQTDLSQSDLRGALLSGAHMWKTKVFGADVSTDVYSDLEAHAPSLITHTDLSKTRQLTQEQLDSMKGDSGTILPKGLNRPMHWPEFIPPATTAMIVETVDTAKIDFSAVQSDAPPKDETPTTHETKTLPLGMTVKQRSISDIRASLNRDYSDIESLSSYIVAQLQNEIAAHEMTAKPNSDEGLNEWNAKANFLNETLVAVQNLHSAIPETPAQTVSDGTAKDIKQRLIDLGNWLQRLIKSLDENNGTMGNFWKLGVIGLGVQLLGLFGVSTTLALPAAAGVVGVNTVRVLIGKDR